MVTENHSFPGERYHQVYLFFKPIELLFFKLVEPREYMNELIQINQIEGRQTINARDLHMFLESKQRFGDWITNRITTYNFIKGQDFIIISCKSPNGRPYKEYHIVLDMAKELSMVERNEKGQQARQYFIECERQVNKQIAPVPSLEKSAIDTLKYIADDLEASKHSKLQMYTEYLTISGQHKAAKAISFLKPTEQHETTLKRTLKPLSVLIDKFQLNTSATKINNTLIKHDILKMQKASNARSSNKYKILTKLGLQYGENLRGVQPYYYEDTFPELVKNYLKV